MMTQPISTLFFCLMIFDITWGEWSSTGRSQSFVFDTKNFTIGVQVNWKLKTDEETKTYFACSLNPIKICAHDEDIDQEVYSANITSNYPSSLISVFNIKTVTPFQNNKVWFSEQIDALNYFVVKWYELHVFAIAEKPMCDNVTVINESNIQSHCWTKKVFPGSICVFYLKTNASTEIELNQGYIIYTNEENHTTGYYKTNCTFQVSAANIGSGFHEFRVVMYPNITSNVTEGLNQTSQYTTAIYIGYPMALLRTDCQVQGYIKENVSSSCTCYDNSTSILNTIISWSSSQSFTLKKGTLEFFARRGESFQCAISNYLNWTNTILFEPNISYPPDTVSVNINRDTFDTCTDTNIAISGTCSVSESNPEPFVNVKINNFIMKITSFKSNEYNFNNTMISTGVFYVSCHASNAEYSKNTSSTTRNVTIKGPPDIPKIFMNNNSERNHLLELTDGDTITCQSKGGFPIFKILSLTCGHQETRETYQDQVSIIFNISNLTNGTCECIVWHESKCLRNTTTVQFKVKATGTFQGEDNDFVNVYIGVGFAAGSVLVIIAIIFILNKLRFSQFDRNLRGSSENLVNNEELYFIKQGKSGIDKNIFPEYTNVVTTMASALEPPKNLKAKD